MGRAGEGRGLGYVCGGALGKGLRGVRVPNAQAYRSFGRSSSRSRGTFATAGCTAPSRPCPWTGLRSPGKATRRCPRIVSPWAGTGHSVRTAACSTLHAERGGRFHIARARLGRAVREGVLVEGRWRVLHRLEARGRVTRSRRGRCFESALAIYRSSHRRSICSRCSRGRTASSAPILGSATRHLRGAKSKSGLRDAQFPQPRRRAIYCVYTTRSEFESSLSIILLSVQLGPRGRHWANSTPRFLKHPNWGDWHARPVSGAKQSPQSFTLSFQRGHSQWSSSTHAMVPP